MARRYYQAAGPLRHTVKIQKLINTSTTLDSYGQPTPNWGTRATMRAAIEPMRGTEAMQAHQQFATQAYKFTSRFTPNVSYQDRLSWNGRTFHIQEIRDLEMRGRVMEIVATEELPNG